MNRRAQLRNVSWLGSPTPTDNWFIRLMGIATPNTSGLTTPENMETNILEVLMERILLAALEVQMDLRLGHV